MASRRLSLLQNRSRRWSNPLLVFLGGGGETVRTDAAVATTLSSCGVTNPMQHRPHQHRGSGRHFASSAVKVSEERRRARNIGISAFFYLCCCALLFLSLSDWSIDRSIERPISFFKKESKPAAVANDTPMLRLLSYAFSLLRSLALWQNFISSCTRTPRSI